MPTDGVAAGPHRGVDRGSQRGYRVDREQAGELHLVLARDWEGEVAGHYVISAGEGGFHIDEVRQPHR